MIGKSTNSHSPTTPYPMPSGMTIEAHLVGRNTLITKYYKALYNIVQLTNIARPTTMREYIYSLVIYALYSHLAARTYLRNEVVDKEAYVALALTQWRNIYLYDTQAMI